MKRINYVPNHIPEGKSKPVPVLNQAPRHEDVLGGGGGGGIATRIDFGTKRKWVISFTLRPLYRQGKEPPVSIG
jgi:hypothetical protein